MIQLGVLGASGRMGRLIEQLVSQEFSKTIELKSSVTRRQPIAPLLSCQVVIDVSAPNAMTELAQFALQKPNPLPAFVVGSTGWNPEQKQILKRLSEVTPVLVATNFSIGVFALSEILKKYSPLLKSIGYTPVIVETHHRHKKDAPSGTAITLQHSIDEKHPDSVQTHSIRSGEVIGTHEVTFYGPSDELTFQHHAQDRAVFARGAIQTAVWLAQEKQTKSNMNGLLGIRDYYTSLLETSGIH